jgi:hypothetical protein
MANADQQQQDILVACRAQQQEQQQPSSLMPLREFYCPVSRRLMTEPVTLLNTGAVLSRTSLQAWLRSGEHSPLYCAFLLGCILCSGVA